MEHAETEKQPYKYIHPSTIDQPYPKFKLLRQHNNYQRVVSGMKLRLRIKYKMQMLMWLKLTFTFNGLTNRRG